MQNDVSKSIFLCERIGRAHLSMSEISPRVVTKPMISFPTLPPVLLSTLSTIILCKHSLLFAASLPPFSNNPLPLLSARLAICGRLRRAKRDEAHYLMKGREPNELGGLA